MDPAKQASSLKGYKSPALIGKIQPILRFWVMASAGGNMARRLSRETPIPGETCFQPNSFSGRIEWNFLDFS